jgi:hypothetical protein
VRAFIAHTRTQCCLSVPRVLPHQTGAGKRFTTYGDQKHPGLLPLSFAQLARESSHVSERGKCLSVSFFEIEFNRVCVFDLSDPPPSHASNRR